MNSAASEIEPGKTDPSRPCPHVSFILYATFHLTSIVWPNQVPPSYVLLFPEKSGAQHQGPVSTYGVTDEQSLVSYFSCPRLKTRT